MVWDSRVGKFYGGIDGSSSSGYKVADFNFDFDLSPLTTHSLMLGGDKICMPCFKSILIKSKYNDKQRLLKRDAS